jgi:hypothetical protein
LAELRLSEPYFCAGFFGRPLLEKPTGRPSASRSESGSGHFRAESRSDDIRALRDRGLIKIGREERLVGTRPLAGRAAERHVLGVSAENLVFLAERITY